MPHFTDVDLAPRDISNLTSVDALAAWFARLDYDTSARRTLTPESFGLSTEAVKSIKRIDLLSDNDGDLRVLFVQPRSLTAKIRTDLVRALKKQITDYLLVLASDFDTLEFVLLDRENRTRKGNSKGDTVEAVPRVLSVDRRKPSRLNLRHLRRLTWVSRDRRDAFAQFDKLRQAFQAARHSEEFFDNRGLFSDHFLLERIRLESVWKESPAAAFNKVKQLLAAFEKHREKTQDLVTEETTRRELIEPLFKLLGFTPKANREADNDEPIPDYDLVNAGGDTPTKAFAYRWERWLDGPDLNDADTPLENPGACVVSALEGDCDWLIVTNGRQWRLYGKHAHARSTNFYEVDLVEALAVSDETDPNEAFRYWWLFFRPAAFVARSTLESDRKTAWLDDVLQGSRDHAKRLGDRLKERIFLQIFPSLAQGFLEDRQRRLKIKRAPSEAELGELFEATLTLLYRLLFLLYAESRQLLPVGEAAYGAASLKRLKEEIAEKAGVAQDEVAERLQAALSDSSTAFYDRLSLLFGAMDQGDAGLNVPKYNGGLFNTEPDESDRRSQAISRYLLEHKVPDRSLAVAIDRLSRDQDEKSLALVFIDYKSLEVRHLGSIYEGLLEFRLKIAEQDLTTQVDKKAEKYIPLTDARARRGRGPEVVVAAGKVYLSNDKAERKATGSYYTPDPIVEYIVEQTVGPVLAERLETLRPEFRKVRKTYDNEVKKAKAYPVKQAQGGTWDPVEWGVHQAWIAHRDLVERLFEFRVLDPAMGSGHFLVEAVDFLTDRLLTFLNQFPINPVRAMLAETRRNIVDALTEQGLIVDEKLLTDVNLLKRHVLKRCIYGVDLNPMAVELAKVSLWLDAFTLGAPLSFLDHHLRCGNSLIGATFADLDRVRKGRLFGIDYAPLLEAVRQVLFINRLSDTTAAEVKQSSVQYDHARRNLSGYQIVLDLIVAGHFGQPDGPRILSHAARELDLKNRDAFLAGLTPVESKVVQEVATLSARKDLRFFHWETEFPEAFFGFEDADQRRLKHKDEIAKGSAGFDAVVGNPPWGGLRTLGVFEAAFKSKYAVAKRGTDWFSFFIERSLQIARQRGSYGAVVPSGWQTASESRELRHIIVNEWRISNFVHLPRDVFPDAYTEAVVAVGMVDSSRQLPTSAWSMQCLLFGHSEPLETISRSDVRWFCVAPAEWFEFNDDAKPFFTHWTPAMLAMAKKVAIASSPLSTFCEVQRGISPYHPKRGSVDASRAVALDGELRRYYYDFSGQYVVEYHEAIAEYKPPHIFKGRRGIVRQLISRQFRIQAVIAEESFVVNQSHQLLIPLRPKSGEIDYVIGFVNSRLLSFLHVNRSAIAMRDDFPKLVLEDTRDFPIPRLHAKISIENGKKSLARIVNGSLQVSDVSTTELASVVSAAVGELTDCRRKVSIVKRNLLSDVMQVFLAGATDDCDAIEKMSGKTVFDNLFGESVSRQEVATSADVVNVLSQNRRKGHPMSPTDGVAIDKMLDEARGVVVPLIMHAKALDTLIDMCFYQILGLDGDEVGEIDAWYSRVL